MKVRIDKCSTFGMRKQSGNYMQFQPMLTIGGKTIPAIEIVVHLNILEKFSIMT